MTFSTIYDFIPISRPCCKGRLISVMRRGAGCGGRCCVQDVAQAAEAQAAMIRLTGRGSPAEDKKLAAPARVSVLRGCRRASLKHRARNAGLSAVRDDCSCGSSHFPHEAAGRLRARRSARPCFKGWNASSECDLEYRRTRAVQRTGTAELGHGRRNSVKPSSTRLFKLEPIEAPSFNPPDLG